MTRLIEKHLAKWRADVQADIDTLREQMDELLGVLAWLDEQAGTPAPPAPVPPEPEAAPPEPPSEAPAAPAEAPVAMDEAGPSEAPAEAEPQPGGRWGTYTRVSLAQVRDLVRTHGPMTAGEAAAALGCSDGNVRPKLQKWVEKGTMESETITMQNEDGKSFRTTVYRMKGIEHSPLRARRERSPSSLRLVGGIAQTGKRNVKVMKRRGKIKGAKGQ